MSPCLAPREEKELITEGSELTGSPGQSEEESKCLLFIAHVHHSFSSLCDMSYHTDETLEEANIRLNHVVSEHMGTIVQLRRKISSLRDMMDQYEAEIDNLRDMW